jgi:hypothetical protein
MGGGRRSVVDGARSVRPPTVTRVEIKKQTDQHIRDNRRNNIDAV